MNFLSIDFVFCPTLLGALYYTSSLNPSANRATLDRPVDRVQSLAERGVTDIPNRYVKPPSWRPNISEARDGAAIPVIDMQGLLERDASWLEKVTNASREWGFFHLVNHGVDTGLMQRLRATWAEFFALPPQLKEAYANSPATYEGYGSRVGVEKDAVLDWGDYFLLVYSPLRRRDHAKWPAIPSNLSEVVEEYGTVLERLFRKLTEILSLSLGLSEDALPGALGVDDGGCLLRVNLYSKCPQPDLALGLSPHSDPGALTILFADDHVPGLQVRKGREWVTVHSLPGALIVNIGDQIQVLTNDKYKSVEHRVVVNAENERMSIAFFCNPRGDLPIAPMQELLGPHQPPLYPSMTYNEYRVLIRTRGLRGKSHIRSCKASSSQDA